MRSNGCMRSSSAASRRRRCCRPPRPRPCCSGPCLPQGRSPCARSTAGRASARHSPSKHRLTAPPDTSWLFSGSGVMRSSGHQSGDKGAEQSFAAAARVVHELEEAEIVWQLVLRNASMWSQPRAQQRPEALHCVDVHLAEAVAILIARVFAMRVANRFVLVAPDRQARVDVILVCVDQAALADIGLDDRLDTRLLHIGQHVQNHLTTTFDQAEDRWLVLLLRATARRACQPATASEPPLLATAAGWPLCPATT